MKTQFYIFLMIVILTSCKKDIGTVLYEIKFTTSEIIEVNNAKSIDAKKSAPDDL